jgi:hypothetical protein
VVRPWGAIVWPWGAVVWPWGAVDKHAQLPSFRSL